MPNPPENANQRTRSEAELTTSKQTPTKSIRYVDNRTEMNDASRNLKPGEVVVFRDIDPEVLQDFLDFEWTDADESSLEFDEQEI